MTKPRGRFVGKWYQACELIGGLLFLNVMTVAGSVHAGDKLGFGPIEPWVRPIKRADVVRDPHAVYQVLNNSIQARFADDGDEYYTETMLRIDAPVGLTFGHVAVAWSPSNDDITINKIQIHRGDQIVDLLTTGNKFTIARREPGLEDEMIDDQLTAFLEPDGLQVGDVVDFAYTLKQKIPMLAGRSEFLINNLGSSDIGQKDYRFLWPNAKPIQWRISDDMLPPDLVKTGDVTELDLRFDGYKRPPIPALAPSRFRHFGEVQLTQFSSWAEASALLAPYYDRAATLTQNSPLKAEVEKIRTLSPDKTIQAAAAMRLVEERVRYVYVRAKSGGYFPPSADLTWLSRWGDCKAKSSLLLALLRELGITADAALVNSADGDGMNARLPALALFNHVIVRASIAGKIYWLDGTHDIDGPLAGLEVPRFKWALPLTIKGEDLRPLVVAPGLAPSSEEHIYLDVSEGLTKPARAHIELVYRGNSAFTINLRWQSTAPETFATNMNTYWHKYYPWLDVSNSSQHFDPETAEMHYEVTGFAKMDWEASSDPDGSLYELDNASLAGAIILPNRMAGLHMDAPVAVQFPSYKLATETILLPKDGHDFQVIGDAVSKTEAGVKMTRTLSLEGGTLNMEAIQQSLVPEISYDEAKAVQADVTALKTGRVFILETRPKDDLAPNATVSAATGVPSSGIGATDLSRHDEDAISPLADRQKSKPATDTPPSGLTPPPPSLEDLVAIYRGGATMP